MTESGGYVIYALAVYVDKIFRGAEVADLPVEQPAELELVLTVEAATAIGLSFPPSLARPAPSA